jgi:O-antigen/teichoic acid export membrane protein
MTPCQPGSPTTRATDTAANASIFKPALVLMTGRMVGFVATFFMPVVLVRIFSQTEFGTYKQIFLIYSTLFAVAPLGMAESLFYFLPATPHGGRYLINAMLFLSGAGALCLILLGGAAPAIGHWLNNGALPGYMLLLGVYLMLTIVSAVLEIAMVSRNRFVYASAVYATSEVMRAAFLVVPALLTRRLEWLLAGAVIFASLRLCGTAYYTGREFRGGLKPDTTLLRQQLAYALPFGLGIPFGIFLSNFHQYAVSHYFDTATYAVYAVGCLQIPLVDFIATSTSNVMMVRMREAVGGAQHEAVATLWRDTTKKLALVIFPAVCLLLLVGHGLIVVLFTNAYRGSVPIFRIWTLIIVFAALQTDSVIRVYGKMRFALALSILKCLLVVPLTVWLLFAVGLAGAALAAVAVALVDRIVALAGIARFMQATLASLLPWRSLATISAAAAIAALPAAALTRAASAPTLPGLAGTAAVYGVAYLCLLYGVGVLKNGEAAAAQGWLRRAIGAL